MDFRGGREMAYMGGLGWVLREDMGGNGLEAWDMGKKSMVSLKNFSSDHRERESKYSHVCA